MAFSFIKKQNDPNLVAGSVLPLVNIFRLVHVLVPLQSMTSCNRKIKLLLETRYSYSTKQLLVLTNEANYILPEDKC